MDEKDEREKKKLPKFKYIAPCPWEECEGFVGENWRCGLCRKKACAKCHQGKLSKKDPEYVKHVCDPGDRETAKLLNKDTKPCPGCSVPITFISGCDQMWCPECHTAFSWVTGEVETGVVHNPHYYQFQRKQNGGVAPRVRNDIRCGGVPDIWRVRTHFTRVKVVTMPEWMNSARRIIDHIQNVELRRYPNELGEGTHVDLRVIKLVNDPPLTEKKWIAELKKREKKREKNRSFHQVLSMFCDTLGDMFANVLEAKDRQAIETVILGMYTLRKYANDYLQKIGDRLKNKVPQINDSWEYVAVGGGRRRY